MIIKSIQVQNFCCIKDQTLPCERLTVLVGPNGAGKSSFLRALNIFYSPNAKYTEDDFYNKEIANEIIITVTFKDLTEQEKILFKKYVENEELTVEKILRYPTGAGSQKYYGTALQNPEFDSFREATGQNIRVEYNKLRDNKYSDFPTYTNKSDAEKTLKDWEASNPDKCIRQRDDGQFFGFKEVGESHLERFTHFILIPAVRDASTDAEEKRGSVLNEIMDLVVRNVLAQKKEISDLREETKTKYDEILNPENLTELKNLETDLTNTLKTYVPDSGVKLTWMTGEGIEIPMPKADIKLLEDSYASSVERTGHGLQRAFIMTMLQHLAFAQTPIQKDEKTIKRPNLIIGIEEPELYQHPNRQRHLSEIFFRLAQGEIKGVAESTQIMYTTHSPLFVDIKRFDKVRALRKYQVEDAIPKQTKVIHTNLDDIARIIEKADGKPENTYTGKTLEPRLQTLMTPWMNEGFFADLAVLVEGEEDRAAILGFAQHLDYNFQSLGISVIPCMGKNNIDRPRAIFNKLCIPTYAIWDSDFENDEAKPEENHRLLRLFGQEIEDWPEKVNDEFACFKKDLNSKLKEEIGEEIFETTLRKLCEELCLGKKKQALKNPLIIIKIIKRAKDQNKSSPTLEKIIKKIIQLRKSKTHEA